MTGRKPGKPKKQRTGDFSLRLAPAGDDQRSPLDEARAQLATAREQCRAGAWEEAASTAATVEAVVRRELAGLDAGIGDTVAGELRAVAGGAAVVTGLARSAQGSPVAAARSFQQAVESLRSAMSVLPPSAELGADLGVALAGAGGTDHDEAVRLLESAGTDDLFVHRSLGVALLADNRPHDALQVLDAVTEAAPDDWLAAEAYATAAERVEGVDGAGDAWGAAAETMWAAGLQDKALAAIARADELMPGDWRVLHLRAIIHLATGVLDDALTNAREADRIAPSARTKGLLSQILDELGRPLEALAVLEAAIEDDPSEIEPRLHKVRLLLALDRPDDALDVTRPLAGDLGDEHPEIALLHGSALLALGDTAASIEPLSAAARLDPDDPVARARLGFALAAEGDLAAAAQHLDRSIDLDGTYVWALARRAGVRADLDDPAGAQADLERAIELAPRLPELVEQLGDLHFNGGDFAAAAAAYETLTELAPESANGWLKRGDAHMSTEDYRAAADSYARASELAPVNASAAAAHSRALLSLEDPDEMREAERLARTAIALDGQAFDGHFQLGIALALQDDYEGALVAFDDALAIDPDDAEAAANRGQALALLGRGGEAADALSRAAQLAPDDLRVQGGFATTVLDFATELDVSAYAEQLRAAASCLSSASEPGETDVEDLFLAGRVFSQLEDPRRAEELYRTVLQRVPDSASVHSALGDVLAGTRRLDEAIEMYEEAARLDPAEVYPLHRAGELQSELGRYAESAAVLERARDANPEAAEVRGFLGDVYRMLGRLDDALREVNLALDAKEIPWALGVRGAVLHGMGDSRAAETDLRRALELNAKDALARFFLQSAFTALGRHPEATEMLGELAQRYPEETDIHVEYADALRLDGEVARALTTIEQVAWDRPEDPYVLRVAGAILLASGRRDEALVSYSRAAAIAPSVETLTELADAQARTGQAVEALRTIDAAIALKPDRWPLVRKSWLLADLAAYAEAAQVARQAVARPPLDSSAHAALCWALEHSSGGDPHEVLAHAEEAIRLDQTAPWLHKMHANALWVLDRPEAADSYERAIALIDEQHNVDEHYNKAWCLHRLRRYPEALKLYRRVLADRSEEQVSLLFDIGLVTLEMNEPEQAEDAYGQGLDIVGSGADLRARGWLAVGAYDLRNSLRRKLVDRSATVDDLLGRLDSRLAGFPLPDLAPVTEGVEMH